MSNVMESCVGKTHNEISKIFFAKHGDTHETRKIDAKWRKLGSEA